MSNYSASNPTINGSNLPGDLSQSSRHTPNQVGRYRILELLGQGGMGVVYRANDPSLAREVVVKYITRQDMMHDEESQRRFRREVQAAAQLNHPNIVTIYDVGLDHEPPYVVMELLTGMTLKEWLQGKTLSWREALLLLRPLIEALNYAHQKGIIHRDVKPANVMFAQADALVQAKGNAEGLLKLVDFGLARWQREEQMTQTGAVIGTPTYMSPEQARGEVVDHRADIFALGIILFEAIAGYNPQDKGSSIQTLVEAGTESQIDISPLVGKAPLNVINLVERAVAKDREQRYLDCESLLADLDECLNAAKSSSAIFPAESSTVNRSDHNLDIRVAGDIDLTPEATAVLKTMFATYRQVAVEAEYNRGFSGSRVFRIRLKDDKKTHVPTVIKIAHIGLIRREWQAYRAWVANTLPNVARLDTSPILPVEGVWSSLLYSLVGGGTFEVQSLGDYYQQAKIEDICWVLEQRLFEIMGPNWWQDNRANRTFQMQSDYDRLLPVNLIIEFNASLDETVQVINAAPFFAPPAVSIGEQVLIKGFVVSKVDLQKQRVTLNLPSAPDQQASASYQVRLINAPDMAAYEVGETVESVRGKVVATRHSLLTGYVHAAFGEEFDSSAEELVLPTGSPSAIAPRLPNPLLTYPKLLRDFSTVNISTIHGDLNIENILIDPETREVNLIDFATVRQGHALHDLLRLEIDIVTRHVPTALVKAGLPPETIYPFYQRLYQATLFPDHTEFHRSPWPTLEKPYQVLRIIRKMARKCLFNLDNWGEYYRGLVIYFLGALKYQSLSDLPSAPIPKQVAFLAAAAMQSQLHTVSNLDTERHKPEDIVVFSPSAPQPKTIEIEPPFGTMRANSRLYIERAADQQCWNRLNAGHAATLFVQAPRQMGKSSLMRRMLDHIDQSQLKRTAFIDFQIIPEQHFNDEREFLIELCVMISEALDIPEAIDDYWRGRRADIRKCSRYISEYIMPHLNTPLILAMDEVERMLTSPFRANFFGMLRTWHNNRVFDENFAKITLFLSSSTEPFLFIDNPNQSPFNVAETFLLHDFGKAEVEMLNHRHGSPLTASQVNDLMDLINGHPFLTRLALYQLTTGKVTDFESLLAQAHEDHGPFGDHLSHYLRRVLQQPELKQALSVICRDYAYEENQIFYRLKGAGLITQEGQQVKFRNKLYDRYFKEHLHV